MSEYKTICIIGGGSLGNTIAGKMSKKGYTVNLLTGHPENWSDTLEIHDCNAISFKTALHVISNKPEEVIPESDIILFCLPGYLISDMLTKIAPFITSRHEIGSTV